MAASETRFHPGTPRHVRNRVQAERPKFFQCGCCDHWHPQGWTGDCRDNDARFTTGQLDILFPDKNGDGWPDWIEVDET